MKQLKNVHFSTYMYIRYGWWSLSCCRRFMRHLIINKKFCKCVRCWLHLYVCLALKIFMKRREDGWWEHYANEIEHYCCVNNVVNYNNHRSIMTIITHSYVWKLEVAYDTHSTYSHICSEWPFSIWLLFLVLFCFHRSKERKKKWSHTHFLLNGKMETILFFFLLEMNISFESRISFRLIGPINLANNEPSKE